MLIATITKRFRCRLRRQLTWCRITTKEARYAGEVGYKSLISLL